MHSIIRVWFVWSLSYKHLLERKSINLCGCCNFSYIHCIDQIILSGFGMHIKFCWGINCPYVILFAINQLMHASLIQRRDLIQNPMIRIYGHRVARVLLLTGIYHATLSRWFLSSYKEVYNEIYTEFAIYILVMLELSKYA